MIKNDIPVIMSFDNTQQKITNYIFDTALPKELVLYNTNNYTSYSDETTIKSHYMTITGVIEYSQDIVLKNTNEIPSEIMLQVSSWGKKYYVSYDEYKNSLGVFSNILVIR